MRHSNKAALRGEPGYVWRSGQERRMGMIQKWAKLEGAVILDDGCGLGTYLDQFRLLGRRCFGLEVEFERAAKAIPAAAGIAQGVGEHLPFPRNSFDFVFSNEVIEHVQDDAAYAAEMVRVVKPGGRLLLFCPNRWYPVEQHGIFWRGRYKFGNIPLVNYLPNPLRNRLAPHVRTYTKKGILSLFQNQPVTIIHHGRIFGGYDNIMNHWPRLGRFLQKSLYAAESTPFAVLGISHLLVLEK